MKATKDDRIIIALLTYPTVKQAAESCGISRRTVYKRLQDAEFKSRYDEERRAMLDRNAAALQTHLSAAIDALGEIVRDKDANQQTRLNAADTIIKDVLKLTERADVLDRLDELERRLQ